MWCWLTDSLRQEKKKKRKHKSRIPSESDNSDSCNSDAGGDQPSRKKAKTDEKASASQKKKKKKKHHKKKHKEWGADATQQALLLQHASHPPPLLLAAPSNQSEKRTAATVPLALRQKGFPSLNGSIVSYSIPEGLSLIFFVSATKRERGSQLPFGRSSAQMLRLSVWHFSPPVICFFRASCQGCSQSLGNNPWALYKRHVKQSTSGAASLAGMTAGCWFSISQPFRMPLEGTAGTSSELTV